MDEMYNNENNSSFENQDSAYGGQYQQPSVQDQLQYQYQQPESNLEEPMTLGEWLITMLIMLIPCVNIIMAFVWAFSSKEKKSKSNYFKAWLIFICMDIRHRSPSKTYFPHPTKRLYYRSDCQNRMDS